MAHFGVHVTAVASGFFRTDFLDPSSATYTENAIADYQKPLAAFRTFHHERNQNRAGDPAKLGEVLVHLATLDNPPTSFVAGSDAVEWATNVAQEHLETGKTIVLRGINVFRIADGKIVERWGQLDQLGLLHQLGLAPA
jgi:NAD(P)-dependent dehydrogenase (short-subunit alcohol dehydrogenase family)